MKCQVCGEVVRGKYLVYKESPICEKDFRVSEAELSLLIDCGEAGGGARV